MAEILDGKKVAEKILAALKKDLTSFKKPLSLAAVIVGKTPAIEKFIGQKQKIAHELGVDFRMYEYESSISTNELRKRLATIVHDVDPDGIIVQLPLPEHINAQYILNSVPAGKDVDVLSARAVGDFAVGKSKILPPVVGAVEAFFTEYNIPYRDKYLVLVGAGNLAGRPLATWLLNEKVTFSVVRSSTPKIQEFIARADILITGAGRPGLVSGNMVKDGVVVIDAGTSESAGKLVGDVDFESVSKKASYITPVPGGVGPVTVAMIYQNLFLLAASQKVEA